MGWVSRSAMPILTTIAVGVTLSSCTTQPPLPSASPTADALPTLLRGVVGLPEVDVQQLPGTVTTIRGCVALAVDGMSTYPVVWGPDVERADPDTLSIDGSRVELGRHLTTTLGHVVTADSLTDMVPDIDSCVDTTSDLIVVLLAGVTPNLEGQ